MKMPGLISSLCNLRVGRDTEKHDYALLLKATTRASLFFRSLARACSSRPKPHWSYNHILRWHNDEMSPAFSYFSQAETAPCILDKLPQPVCPHKLDRNPDT